MAILDFGGGGYGGGGAGTGLRALPKIPRLVGILVGIMGISLVFLWYFSWWDTGGSG